MQKLIDALEAIRIRKEAIQLQDGAFRSLEMQIHPYFYETSIPKSTGRRYLQVPHESYRELLKVVNEELVKEFPAPVCSMATKGKGIYYNASLHKDAVEILKVDIKDFYQNCTGRTLYSNDPYHEVDIGRVLEPYLDILMYHPQMVGHTASFETKQASWLPTGSPTSPHLSNFSLTWFDRIATQVAINNKGVYTRYLDDLIFSFDREISSNDKDTLLNHVIGALGQMNFQVNQNKTKWINPKQDQWAITGVRINPVGLSIPRKYTNKLRGELNSYANIVVDSLLPYGTMPLKIILGVRLLGKLEFIRQASREQYSSLLEYFVHRTEVISIKRNKTGLVYSLSPRWRNEISELTNR